MLFPVNSSPVMANTRWARVVRSAFGTDTHCSKRLTAQSRLIHLPLTMSVSSEMSVSDGLAGKRPLPPLAIQDKNEGLAQRLQDQEYGHTYREPQDAETGESR